LGLFGGKEAESAQPAWEREWVRAGQVYESGDHAGAKKIFENLLRDPAVPADKKFMLEENLRVIVAADAGMDWYARLGEVQRHIGEGNPGRAHEILAEIVNTPGLPASQRASMCLNLVLTASMLGDEEGALAWFDEAARESRRDFAEQVGHILKSIEGHQPEQAQAIRGRLGEMGER